MSDRGMKKWAPYSSLIEQATCLDKMIYNKNKISKPILENDKIEEINYYLQTYRGQIASIKFYSDGYIYLIQSTIKKIDIENKRLILENGKLAFTQILGIE